jgi:ABC-type transporter Mla maintaining outer membrane lipid asymmetry ATPase subunit MlaF
MNDEAPAVEVDVLAVIRGSRELRAAISLSVLRGQVAGLLGRHGGGKTGGKTIVLPSIVGVHVVAPGTVTVRGEIVGSTRHQGSTTAATRWSAATLSLNLRSTVVSSSATLASRALQLPSTLSTSSTPPGWTRRTSSSG